MTPLAQFVIVACIVVLTAALVSTLLALRRTAARAETVLQLLEREIRPLSSQLGALADELRGLSRRASREMERLDGVVDRVEDVTWKISRLVAVAGSLSKVGQVAAVATGVKKGLDVFLSRLRNRQGT